MQQVQELEMLEVELSSNMLRGALFERPIGISVGTYGNWLKYFLHQQYQQLPNWRYSPNAFEGLVLMLYGLVYISQYSYSTTLIIT